ncbi:putative family pyridoxal phosphate enzyme [Rosellinia necatrix]|uniref:Pyridoxal phosphate homeostasis protein n=1 Tax=Rosellinia necatrix TaxID=77044 RepID=A0A1W2TC92_ROSNE|nr:putative family pyridoxal phosphate enzyme [Rosellinia necatrix]
MGDVEEEMKIDPSRAAALASQIKGVSERIAAVSNGRNVRLVAVSKLKPANDILALAQPPEEPGAEPQLHFGENYAQELAQKAELLPRHIRWHFIGGLQSGHCKNLAKIPNLWCVSSVDTPKKAQLLDRYRGEFLSAFSTTTASSSASSSGDPPPAVAEKLNIHVQVNTSGEASKSGCAPGAETVALCRAVEDAPHLRLLGLMTIGAIARSVAASAAPGGENEDFLALRAQRDLVVAELGLGPDRPLELSMGMSEDFEGAVALGSDEVRVGSTIFGTRPSRAEAKVRE